jgi:hypothetical protein
MREILERKRAKTQPSGKRAGDDSDGDTAPQRGARAGAATQTPTSDTGGMRSQTRSASNKEAGNKDKAEEDERAGASKEEEDEEEEYK